LHSDHDFVGAASVRLKAARRSWWIGADLKVAWRADLKVCVAGQT
jgi:hypothetical protein